MYCWQECRTESDLLVWSVASQDHGRPNLGSPFGCCANRRRQGKRSLSHSRLLYIGYAQSWSRAVGGSRRGSCARARQAQYRRFGFGWRGRFAWRSRSWSSSRWYERSS